MSNLGRQKKYMYKLNPHCERCGVLMVLPEDTDNKIIRPDGSYNVPYPPPNMATIQHRYCKIHPKRHKPQKGERRRFLWCYECNQYYNEKYENPEANKDLMRLNSKNFALGLLENPDAFNFHFPDPVVPDRSPQHLRDFGNSFIEGSKALKPHWEKNIQYVSKPFFEAFAKAKPKLKDLFYQEEIEDSGVLLTGGFTNGYTHTHTMYYVVYSIKGEDGKIWYNVMYTDFSRHVNSTTAALDVYVSYFLKPGEENVDIKHSIWEGYIKDERDHGYWVTFIVMFCLFKKYCDIETKVTEPKNRRAKVGNNKYINETDKRIQILDATWFTNLVVSGAFGVSGHLRWQRYGPGNTQKKLIWIDEFVKEGYTRKAKAITEQENDNNENK